MDENKNDSGGNVFQPGTISVVPYCSPLGSEPEPKLTFEVDMRVVVGYSYHYIEVRLLAGGKIWRKARWERRPFQDWTPRYHRKMRKKIKDSKRALLAAYYLEREESGPVL